MRENRPETKSQVKNISVLSEKKFEYTDRAKYVI